MDPTITDLKQKILRQVTIIEKRLEHLKNRKLLSINWQEHNVLRFQIIDECYERTRLLSKLK